MKILKKVSALAAVSSLLLVGGSTMDASEGTSRQLDPATNPSSLSDIWVCEDCTENEQIVLQALQQKGITDKTALSVVMGNIKQESKFDTTICEGGKRTGYHGCHRGGFGLIQWTTPGRYRGLGATAKGLQLDPNSLDAQLAWMFKEREWKSVVERFKNPGQGLSYYMNAAFRWLGWGVHGARTHYAQTYASQLQQVK